MKSTEALKTIMDSVTDEFVICSTGMISREIYNIKDRKRNFYVMGSMGASLGIGIGLALNRPEYKFIVVAGDGDILMSMGTLVLMNKLLLPNLYLYIIDNNCYSSTGCQPTCSDAVDFESISLCTVIKVDREKADVGRVELSHREIKERFYNEINSC